eukprot:sb/3468565/
MVGGKGFSDKLGCPVYIGVNFIVLTPRSPPPGKNSMCVARGYVNAVNSLLKDLKNKFVSFVRCIKPNLSSTPRLVEDDIMEDQIRSSCLVETALIKQNGFAFSSDIISFVQRYKCTHEEDMFRRCDGDWRMAAERICVRSSCLVETALIKQNGFAFSSDIISFVQRYKCTHEEDMFRRCDGDWRMAAERICGNLQIDQYSYFVGMSYPTVLEKEVQSDPDLVPPDLVTPRFSDRINFPQYRKLTVFDPDLVATPI